MRSCLKNDPAFIENASLELSEQITEYMQEVAREEVDALASDITDQYVSNAATVEDAKGEVQDYVFSRIDINRARMTLALWDRNS